MPIDNEDSLIIAAAVTMITERSQPTPVNQDLKLWELLQLKSNKCFLKIKNKFVKSFANRQNLLHNPNSYFGSEVCDNTQLENY